MHEENEQLFVEFCRSEYAGPVLAKIAQCIDSSEERVLSNEFETIVAAAKSDGEVGLLAKFQERINKYTM